MDFDVNLGMSTGQSPEASGETRILACGEYSGPSSSADFWNANATSLDITPSEDGNVATLSRGDIGGGCAGGYNFGLNVDGVEIARAGASVAGGHGGSRSFSHMTAYAVTAGTTYNITLTNSHPCSGIGNPYILVFPL